jgi:hypothetical protein
MSRFKRDYRRGKSGQLGKKLDSLLMEVVNLLVADSPSSRIGVVFDPAPVADQRVIRKGLHYRG